MTMHETSTTDTIEKRRIIKAPRSRVWRAISDYREFGSWFRMAFEAPFVPGAVVKGAVQEKGYEHAIATVWIERVEPEHTLTMRWHPYALDPNHDYSGEPKTLIVFALADHPDGTELTITESGFDAIPEWRRAEALRMNTGGWAIQIERVSAYVTRDI